MHIFGGEHVANFYTKMNLDENIPIKVKFIAKQLEMAQKRVEGINFESRKRTLNYDDVMNAQREIIYSQRRMVLDGDKDIDTHIRKMLSDTVDMILDTFKEELETKNGNRIVLRQEIINTLAIDPE